MSGGWIGVDFDGTLAEHKHTEPWDSSAMPEPIPLMVGRVQGWLNMGIEVRILTARVGCCFELNDEGIADNLAFAENQRALVQRWCLKHVGTVLPVTASKDFRMIALYDDRAVRVRTNTGEIVGEDA